MDNEKHHHKPRKTKFLIDFTNRKGEKSWQVSEKDATVSPFDSRAQTAYVGNCVGTTDGECVLPHEFEKTLEQSLRSWLCARLIWSGEYHDSLKDLQPTDVLYPGMVTTTNIGIVAKKALIRANVEVGEPYNLRRSYCSDMFEMGIDPALYKLCTDHSTQVSMKHYQIMHEGRIQRGLDSIKMFPDTPTEEPEAGDSKAA